MSVWAILPYTAPVLLYQDSAQQPVQEVMEDERRGAEQEKGAALPETSQEEGPTPQQVSGAENQETNPKVTEKKGVFHQLYMSVPREKDKPFSLS